jgi:hypothetical protein
MAADRDVFQDLLTLGRRQKAFYVRRQRISVGMKSLCPHPGSSPGREPLAQQIGEFRHC